MGMPNSNILGRWTAVNVRRVFITINHDTLTVLSRAHQINKSITSHPLTILPLSSASTLEKDRAHYTKQTTLP